MTLYINPNPQMKALAKRVFKYTGNKFEVVSAESIQCASYWDGGTRSYYAVVDGDTPRAIDPSHLLPDSPPAPTIHVVGECGGMFQPIAPTIAIGPNTVVIRHSIFCGRDMGITFYVNPARLPQYLPASSVELSRAEKIVLVATRSYKSSYAGDSMIRYHEAFRQTGITLADWQNAQADCIAKGLLNKRGAITVSGKNAIEGISDLWNLKG